MTPNTLPFTRLLVVAAAALAMSSTQIAAQSAPAPRSAFSAFGGGGWAAMSGESSEGGVVGLTLGFAHQGDVRDGRSFRSEIAIRSGGAELGETGIFALPTNISRMGLNFAGMFRWHRERGRYLAAGADVQFDLSCDVHTEGGPGFLGGETVDCDDFTDIPIEAKSVTVGLLLAAGVQRERLGLEVRFAQGLNAAAETPEGSLTPRALMVILNWRLRDRSGSRAISRP